MFKEFFNTDINWLDFYNQMSGYVGIICTVAFSCSIVYLVQRHKKEELLAHGTCGRRETGNVTICIFCDAQLKK